MTTEQLKPVRLELRTHHGSPWLFLLSGAFLGAAFEMLVSLPLDAVFRALIEYIFANSPINLHYALTHLARPGEWPAISLTGFIFGTALGFVFYRLNENQKHLRGVGREFEMQVSALRHHYKNLVLGIGGFSARAKRKLEELQKRLPGLQDLEIHPELDALGRSVTILVEASQRLTNTLTAELVFLKALQSDRLSLVPQDFISILRQAIKELLELRFRGKNIHVEINGQPFDEPSPSLEFAFEPNIMEIILQNILSNAMRYGDFIQVKVTPNFSKVIVEVTDNGPGFDVEEIKHKLISSDGRRDADSTQLGLRVTLHLLEKCDGQLFALSKPGTGATFILKFPQ